MDDSVIAAIAKWPHVPAVFGWLILTARGEWRLRGESIANQAICDFIGRNYTHDEQGRWFFQNGPQSVFVDLEVTPWIWRVGAEPGAALRSHTARPAERLRGAWLDESGRLFLQTDIGFGLLDSADSGRAAGCFRVNGEHEVAPDDLEAWLAGGSSRVVVSGALLGLQGNADLDRLRADDAPRRFGYIRVPLPD